MPTVWHSKTLANEKAAGSLFQRLDICRDGESNTGHRTFQARALPTELSRLGDRPRFNAWAALPVPLALEDDWEYFVRVACARTSVTKANLVGVGAACAEVGDEQPLASARRQQRRAGSSGHIRSAYHRISHRISRASHSPIRVVRAANEEVAASDRSIFHRCRWTCSNCGFGSRRRSGARLRHGGFFGRMWLL